MVSNFLQVNRLIVSCVIFSHEGAQQMHMMANKERKGRSGLGTKSLKLLVFSKFLDNFPPCPAVSHISNLTVVSSRQSVCVRKAAPMVDSWNSWNWPLTNRSTRDDFPTADSPSKTSCRK